MKLMLDSELVSNFIPETVLVFKSVILGQVFEIEKWAESAPRAE